MTREEINKTIAELCGWTKVVEKRTMLGVKEYVGYPPKGAIVGRKQAIPNYWGDLNACVEFQNKIVGGCFEREWVEYCTNLVGPEVAEDRMKFGRYLCEAPAWLRCRAFLQVKGRWK